MVEWATQMSIVQLVIFKTCAAIYLNQKCHGIIDDISDLEQVLELVKEIGKFEFKIYENDSLIEAYEDLGVVPPLFADAIDMCN